MNYKILVCDAREIVPAPLTIGKTYNVIDGKIIDDFGHVRRWTCSEACLKWLNRWYDFRIIGKWKDSPATTEAEKVVTPKHDDEKIVITCEEKCKIIATKFLGDKEEESVEIGCADTDAFNFIDGAVFALKELQKKEKRPPAVYNGRVVCTADVPNAHGFAKGKIYEVKNGEMSAPHIMNIKSFEDLDDRFPDCKFVEIIG